MSASCTAACWWNKVRSTRSSTIRRLSTHACCSTRRRTSRRWNRKEKAMTREKWVDDILKLWFEELTYEDWFGGAPELDEKIRSRFLDVYERQKAELDVKAIDDPQTALAAIILFDQFPRNMFRKSAAAFATDDLAMGIARLAVDRGYDNQVQPEAKSFIYMPFMHSEVSADQERC